MRLCVGEVRRGITWAMMQLMMMPAGQDVVKLNTMMDGDDEEV